HNRRLVNNFGPGGAGAALLTDTLPAASQLVSVSTSTGACTAPPVGSTGTITCNLGAVASGATATVVIVISPTGKKAMITNSASVSGDVDSIDPVSATTPSRPRFRSSSTSRQRLSRPPPSHFDAVNRRPNGSPARARASTTSGVSIWARS